MTRTLDFFAKDIRNYMESWEADEKRALSEALVDYFYLKAREACREEEVPMFEIYPDYRSVSEIDDWAAEVAEDAITNTRYARYECFESVEQDVESFIDDDISNYLTDRFWARQRHRGYP